MSTEGILHRLRARGWRMTAQRRAVAEALTGEDLHLTADEIFERATARLPEISRATVYNTLNELVDMGEIRAASFDGGVTRRYDPNAVTPHHHLVCTVCGATHDVELDDIEVSLSKRDRRGFEVDNAHIVIEGTCPTCRS